MAPQLPSGFRKYRSDITIFGFFRKVVGTINFTVFKFFGLRLVYNQTSREMLVIDGTDTTATGQNFRHSFGTDRFPVEGIPQRFVLRWNSEYKQLDIFVGDVMYQKAITTATDLYETTEGIVLCDQADFQYAQVVPACLPDSQIIRAVREKSYRGHTFATLPSNAASHLYDRVSDVAVANRPPAIASDCVPFTTLSRSRIALITGPTASLDDYTVSDAVDSREQLLKIPAYRDPLPRVTSVSVDAAHLITVTGTAGPTDAVDCWYWWEIETTPGSTEVVVMADRKETAINLGSVKVIGDQFPVARGFDFNFKRVRLAVQSLRDAKQVWRSPWVQMVGDDFSNNPPTVIYTPPEVVTDAPPAEVAKQQLAAQVKRTARRQRLAEVASTMQVSPRSRYKLTPVYDTTAHGLTYGLLSDLDEFFSNRNDLRKYEVAFAEEYMPDRIMASLFGNGYEDLWWVIAYLNNIVDPTTELSAGTVLSVPSQDSIAAFLSRRSATILSQEE